MPKSKGPRRSGISQGSSVTNLVNQARQALEEEEAGPGAGKGKRGHAGELGRDVRGISKATYNISRTRQDMVRQIAEQLDAPQNDVIEAAIVLLHSTLKRNPKLLDEYLVPARLLSARWRIEPPDEIQIFSDR